MLPFSVDTIIAFMILRKKQIKQMQFVQKAAARVPTDFTAFKKNIKCCNFSEITYQCHI